MLHGEVGQVGLDSTSANQQGIAVHELCHGTFPDATPRRSSIGPWQPSGDENRKRSRLSIAWTLDGGWESSPPCSHFRANNFIDPAVYDELDEGPKCGNGNNICHTSRLGVTDATTRALSSGDSSEAQKPQFYGPDGTDSSFHPYQTSPPGHAATLLFSHSPGDHGPVNLGWANIHRSGGGDGALSTDQGPSFESVFLGKAGFSPNYSGIESPRLLARPLSNYNFADWEQLRHRSLEVVPPRASCSPMSTGSRDSGYVSMSPNSLASSDAITTEAFDASNCFTPKSPDARGKNEDPRTHEPLNFAEANMQPSKKRKGRCKSNLPRLGVSKRSQTRKQRREPVPQADLPEIAAAEKDSFKMASGMPPAVSSNQRCENTISYSALGFTNTLNGDVGASEDDAPGDADQDTSSREPTPFPESWYENGMEVGLSQFAARIMSGTSTHDSSTSHVNSRHESGALIEASTSCDAGSRGEESNANQSSANASQASRLPSQVPCRSGETPNGAGGGDNPDDDSPNPKRQQVMEPPREETSGGPFYACPYQKKRPSESPFCGRPHGSKLFYGWNTVSRVK